jgi:hypothetical protein
MKDGLTDKTSRRKFRKRNGYFGDGIDNNIGQGRITRSERLETALALSLALFKLVSKRGSGQFACSLVERGELLFVELFVGNAIAWLEELLQSTSWLQLQHQYQCHERQAIVHQSLSTINKQAHWRECITSDGQVC